MNTFRLNGRKKSKNRHFMSKLMFVPTIKLRNYLNIKIIIKYSSNNFYQSFSQQKAHRYFIYIIFFFNDKREIILTRS